MFKNSQSYIYFNEDRTPSPSGAVVIYKNEITEQKVELKKFFAGMFLAFSLVLMSFQTAWVYNASAEENPVTSPATSEESASPTASPSATPVTYPEESPSASASASASPSATASAAPISYPEESPSASPSAELKLVVTYPNGGETFYRGEIINIVWEAIGLSNYSIYLVDFLYPQNPVWIATIYDSLQKTYNWNINSLPGEYKIRLVSYGLLNGESISDDSDDNFNILEATPSSTPTESPTASPSASASAQPSESPSESPSVSPSASASPKTSENAGSTSSNSGGNSGGSSSNSGGSVGAPSCNNEAPKSAPIILSAITTGQNEVTLNWEKAKNPVTHYVIAYGLEKGKPLYGNPNVGNVSSYAVKGLSGGVTYYFKVRAGNDCMSGAYSEEIGVKVGGKFIKGPAQNFKPGVLGKTTAVKSISTPAPVASPLAKVQINIGDGGLLGKVFSFFSGFFKP